MKPTKRWPTETWQEPDAKPVDLAITFTGPVDPAAFDYGPFPLPTVLDRDLDLSYTTTIPTYRRRVQVDLVEPMTEVAPGVWEGTVAPPPRCQTTGIPVEDCECWRVDDDPPEEEP
jgi:hypothetical protein